MPILLGAVADDFTGATDLCSMLVRNGMRAVQLIGVPEPGLELPATDAVVVALKSRTAPAGEAVAQSLAALDWLGRQGARQFLFKYCSTFDSTDEGNIGPVADALLDALGADFTVACPAFPETGRAIFKGHLFVGDLLLSDTHMRHHPLTPMTDANLVRVLGRQTRQGRARGLRHGTPRARGDRERFAALRAEGCSYAVTDAIEDEDLRRLGAACADLALITGGSGIAMGLPENFRRAGLLAADVGGRAAGRGGRRGGTRRLLLGGDAGAGRGDGGGAAGAAARPGAARGGLGPGEAVAWAAARMGEGPVLVYASAAPEEAGRSAAAGARARRELVEDALAAVARGVVEAGARRLVVAGGDQRGRGAGAGVKGWRSGRRSTGGARHRLDRSRAEPGAGAEVGQLRGRDFFLKAFATMP